jgi:hypothetical protein
MTKQYTSVFDYDASSESLIRQAEGRGGEEEEEEINVYQRKQHVSRLLP